MKVAVVKASTLARLGTWYAEDVLKIKEEADARGLDLDEDVEEVEQVRKDQTWIRQNKQKVRVLPLP